MFALFERLLQSTTVPEHPEPPAGLIAFYWHFARQAKGLFAGLFAAGFALALLDSLIPVFIGRVVTLITSSQPESLFATFWPMLLGMALVMGGIQFIATGLIGEMLARTYYESQNKAIYALREVKSHRKELGDSAEPARPSGSSER